MSDAQDAKPRISDAEMLERFQNSKKRPPCTETLGMRVEAVDQDKMTIKASFDVSEAFANPTGAVQGGFLTAMLDEIMSTCCIIASNVTMTAPTLELKTSYLAPLFPGKAQASARIIKFGKSIAFMESQLYNADGKLVATATATAAPKTFKRF